MHINNNHADRAGHIIITQSCNYERQTDIHKDRQRDIQAEIQTQRQTDDERDTANCFRRNCIYHWWTTTIYQMSRKRMANQ